MPKKIHTFKVTVDLGKEVSEKAALAACKRLFNVGELLVLNDAKTNTMSFGKVKSLVKAK